MAFYLSIAWVQHRFPFSQPVQAYIIRFEQVNGLLTGDPVLWRGVPVGQVTKIVPQNDGVRVYISLEQEVPFQTNARAELQVKELMGSKQIALFPGDSGKELKAGSEFPGESSLDFTSSFREAGMVFNQFSPELLKGLGGLGDTLAAILRTWTAALPPDRVSHILDETETALVRVNHLTAIAENRALLIKSDSLLVAVKALIQKGNQTTDNVNHLLVSADTLIAGVSPRLAKLDKIANETEALIRTLKNSPAVEMVQDEEFLSDLQTTLSNLNGVLEQIQQEKIYVGFGKNKHKTAQP